MSHTQGKTQIGIINTISYRRDARAVTALSWLLSAADREVANAAATALGHIGGADAAAALRKVLHQVDARFAFTIADAYLACAANFLQVYRQDQALPIYTELYQSSTSSQTRAGALRGLAIAGGANGVQSVIAALREDDPMIKKTAIGCIQVLEGQDVTRRLVDQLPKLPAAQQELLLGALADRGDAAALPAITTAVKNDDSQVRCAALLALGKLGNAATVNTLATAVGSNSAAERNAALGGLKTLSGEGVDEALVSTLAGASPSVRVQLIRVLAERNAVSSVPALLRLASGPDPAVASEACKAAGQLADATALPALLQLLVNGTRRKHTQCSGRSGGCRRAQTTGRNQAG